MASMLASDDFLYNSPGELNAQNGGTGWAGAWSAVTSATQIVDPAVDLSDDKALQVTGNNNNAAYRQLASPFVGDSLFVSFLVQVGAGSLTANDFVALWLDTVTTGDHTSRPNIGIKSDGSGANDVFVRTNGTGGSFVSPSNIGSTIGVTHQIVGRLSRSAPGNYTSFDVWLDPLFGDLSSPDAMFAGSAGISAVSYVGFRSANLDSGDSLLIDDLRLATEWQDVVSVPEPSTVALLGLGLLGVGLFRRRFR